MFELNMDTVRSMIDAGLISRQKHPSLDLYIYNYTNKAAYDRVWTPETTQCRGLILDQYDRLVARPFPKFFNYEEHPRSDILFSRDYHIFEKLDGSLGVLYPEWDTYTPDGQRGSFAIATRGSFTSDQALHATEVLKSRYADFVPLPGCTYLFEIIYPDNRIVVDYGEVDDLFLLAVIQNDTGIDLMTVNGETYGWPGPVVRRYDLPEWYVNADKRGRPNFHKMNWLETLELENDGSQEGLVFLFQTKDGDVRVKMKLEEYKRLHKILTGVNTKTIWEALSQGQQSTIENIIDRVPDEFYNWVHATIDDLRAKFEEIFVAGQQVYRVGLNAMSRVSADNEHERRKHFAAAVASSPYKSIAFALLDGKTYDEMIWRMIKPKAERPFVVDEA